MGGSLTLFIVRKIRFIHAAHIVFFKLQPVLQVFLYVKDVSLVEVCRELIVGVFRDVVLVREKWTNTAKLEDALAAVQDSKLIHTHKLLAKLLIVKGMRNLPASALSGIERINGFFPK